MKKTFLFIVFIFIIVLLVVVFVGFNTTEAPSEESWYYLYNNQTIGTLQQTMTIQYQDGTTGSIDTAWLYHNDKSMESITYGLLATSTNETLHVDTTGYQVGFELLRGSDTQLLNNGVLPTTPGDLYYLSSVSMDDIYEVSFDPFTLVNYSFPDGDYLIMFTPSGRITVNNKETNTPGVFTLRITVLDERVINLDFE